jgi:glutathionyl-hydroquinone reductase
VINLVYWLDKPAVIGDAEIEVIKKVLNGVYRCKDGKSGQRLYHKTAVQLFSINNTIKIILPSLGYLLIAEAKTTDQEISIRTITDQFDLLYPVYAVK